MRRCLYGINVPVPGYRFSKSATTLGKKLRSGAPWSPLPQLDHAPTSRRPAIESSVHGSPRLFLSNTVSGIPRAFEILGPCGGPRRSLVHRSVRSLDFLTSNLGELRVELREHQSHGMLDVTICC